MQFTVQTWTLLRVKVIITPGQQKQTKHILGTLGYVVTLAMGWEAGPCAPNLALRDTLPVITASPNLFLGTEAGLAPLST